MKYYKCCRCTDELVSRLELIGLIAFVLHRNSVDLVEQLRDSDVKYQPWSDQDLGKYSRDLSIIHQLSSELGCISDSL
jgi:hypothetical protein